MNTLIFANEKKTHVDILYSVSCSSFMQRSSEHLQCNHVLEELRWRATLFSVNRRKGCITGMLPPPPPFNEHANATASSLIQHISILFDLFLCETSRTNIGQVICFVRTAGFSLKIITSLTAVDVECGNTSTLGEVA